MPIKIPNDLPAVKTLEGENIFVMTETRAITQDIRPLKILLLNLMPKKIETETQFSRLLGNSPLQVELELIHTKSHKAKNVSEEHLISFYKTFDEVRDNFYDGLIITGAPVEQLPFEEVEYWEELCEIMEWTKKNIQLPVALSTVTEIQNKYLALTGASNNNSSIKSADDVKNISDGEKILKKLTEPYRGKYILVDVWGTWCGPCKAALAKSKELFERMAPYNMVFLYLANRSSDESWKNVIKEYNVVGENIVHYNLPSEQQAAVENYLRVASYPTYRLISPDGSLLDVNADPRDLDIFEKMIKNIKK